MLRKLMERPCITVRSQIERSASDMSEPYISGIRGITRAYYMLYTIMFYIS